MDRAFAGASSRRHVDRRRRTCHLRPARMRLHQVVAERLHVRPQGGRRLRPEQGRPRDTGLRIDDRRGGMHLDDRPHPPLRDTDAHQARGAAHVGRVPGARRRRAGPHESRPKRPTPAPTRRARDPATAPSAQRAVFTKLAISSSINTCILPIVLASAPYSITQERCDRDAIEMHLRCDRDGEPRNARTRRARRRAGVVRGGRSGHAGCLPHARRRRRLSVLPAHPARVPAQTPSHRAHSEVRRVAAAAERAIPPAARPLWRAVRVNIQGMPPHP